MKNKVKMSLDELKAQADNVIGQEMLSKVLGGFLAEAPEDWCHGDRADWDKAVNWGPQ